MNTIELSNHGLCARFHVPEAFVAISYGSAHLSMRVRYPDFTPAPDSGPLTDETVDLHVHLKKGPDRVELLLSGGGPVTEPSYVRQRSRLEPIGPYQIYQEDNALAGTLLRIVTYVFRASDGSMVGVEDPGDEIDRYHYYRRLGKYLQVQFSISKEFGDDFIEVDEAVSVFVKTLLERVWEEDSD